MLRIFPLYFVFLLSVAVAAWIVHGMGFARTQADHLSGFNAGTGPIRSTS
jgi:hypothetical protein